MNRQQSEPIELLGAADDAYLDFRNRLYTGCRSDPPSAYRSLLENERDLLVANGNTAADWNKILVLDGFDPTLVNRCSFFGTVRIGALSPNVLRYHDLALPVGLSDSLIISSDIGSNSVVRNVRYLSRYVVGDEVILFNIDEMGATDHAKFGNGIVMEGEDEEVRIWLEIANENGGRAILPFEHMETGDAHLWTRFRDDIQLQNAFVQMTEAQFDKSRGAYACVGDHVVIKSCRVIKDVKVGPWAYIKGANKLKNLSIASTEEAPTQIGEGAELVNGIIEEGSRIFYGVKAVRFVMRTNTCLKYGARLINSILGDNGTISCCEVLNSLVMPGHEQHHNNSFLCAATLLGQSNIAAGATIGSNHNSRSNDGELVAGRGFWPGLAVSLKHSSKFASFCLIAKGSYPAELNIPLAFTLVATEPDHLILRPAFWFLYDMYALARNSWKYYDRDARLYSHHVYEYDFLAPDTAKEILTTIELLELWTGMIPYADANICLFPDGSFGGIPARVPANMGPETGTENESIQETIIRGRKLLESAVADRSIKERFSAPYTLINAGLEKTSRPVQVHNVFVAWKTYRNMAVLYAVKALLAGIKDDEPLTVSAIESRGFGRNALPWHNVGGQLIREDDLNTLLDDIRSAKLSSWRTVHQRYAEIADSYKRKRAEHALNVLCTLFGAEKIDESVLGTCKRIAAETQRYIEAETRKSREKDYDNPFRTMMYDSPEEMDMVVGSLKNNSFVSLISEQTETFCRGIER